MYHQYNVYIDNKYICLNAPIKHGPSRFFFGNDFLEGSSAFPSCWGAAMMEILRDHNGGICMHGGFETTAAMVSELRERNVATHWLTGDNF